MEYDFELFKSNICHRLKREGDINFIRNNLLEDRISMYYNSKQYEKCFYLLAMLDYVSNENKIDLCNRYDDIRCMSLKETLYPRGILLLAALDKDDSIKEKAKNESIKEFLNFNIVENDVRNVI